MMIEFQCFAQLNYFNLRKESSEMSILPWPEIELKNVSSLFMIDSLLLDTISEFVFNKDGKIKQSKIGIKTVDYKDYSNDLIQSISQNKTATSFNQKNKNHQYRIEISNTFKISDTTVHIFNNDTSTITQLFIH